MNAIIEYINNNKEWLFSGIGVFMLTGCIWFFRKFITLSPANRVIGSKNKSQRNLISNNSTPKELVSIPLGLQSFSFIYGPQGHAKTLTLKGARVSAEIQLTCQIINPYKAMFGANDYALNVLLPRFLLEARGLLELNSLTKLRENRIEVSKNIMSKLSPQFDKLGVRLDSVTIGAIEKIKSAN